MLCITGAFHHIIVYLGHRVTAEGIHPDPKGISATSRRWQLPNSDRSEKVHQAHQSLSEVHKGICQHPKTTKQACVGGEC